MSAAPNAGAGANGARPNGTTSTSARERAAMVGRVPGRDRAADQVADEHGGRVQVAR